jgi:hydroxymethylbilane synthase
VAVDLAVPARPRAVHDRASSASTSRRCARGRENRRLRAPAAAEAELLVEEQLAVLARERTVGERARPSPSCWRSARAFELELAALDVGTLAHLAVARPRGRRALGARRLRALAHVPLARAEAPGARAARAAARGLGGPRVKVRIGTRGSDLALWQARHVGRCSSARARDRDRRARDARRPHRRRAAAAGRGQGLLHGEIERALLERRSTSPCTATRTCPGRTDGLVIAGVPRARGGGERLLVRPEHTRPRRVPAAAPRARVGTSAPRRTAQIAALRPDLERSRCAATFPRACAACARAATTPSCSRRRASIASGSTSPGSSTCRSRGTLVPGAGPGCARVQTRAADGELRALCRASCTTPRADAAVAAERTCSWRSAAAATCRWA